MKVIRFHEIGGPEVLKYEDVQAPEQSAGQVLIKVAASSVNFVDVSRRSGHAPFPPGVNLPQIPGFEVSGVVESVGADVAGWSVGDQVMVRGAGSGYAEYVVATPAQLFKVPASMGLVEAATLPTAFLTAWSAVVKAANVQPGETVLVQACAGGVAIALVQVAKQAGATVIGTSSSDEKLEWAKQFGLDHGINYDTKDFVQEVKALTDGKGVSVVFDGVGGDVLVRGLTALQPFGRMVVYGVSGGSRTAQIVLPELWFRNLSIIGGGGGLTREEMEAVFSKFGDDTFKPTLDRTWPLEQAAEAHRYLEGRKVRGKVALTVG